MCNTVDVTTPAPSTANYSKSSVRLNWSISPLSAAKASALLVSPLECTHFLAELRPALTMPPPWFPSLHMSLKGSLCSSTSPYHLAISSPQQALQGYVMNESKSGVKHHESLSM